MGVGKWLDNKVAKTKVLQDSIKKEKGWDKKIEKIK